MNFLTAACSDVGIKKKVNEDSYCIKVAESIKGNVILAVVCDGMGGLSRGELASATVVREFSKWFERELPKNIVNFHPEKIRSSFYDIIQNLNNRIGEYGRNNGVMLGTTLTATLVIDGFIITAQVGDSRLYEIDNKLKQVTEDQTLVQREVNIGRITKEEAKVDARKNILLQCIGASKIVEPAFIIEKVKKDCTYMICSDGFRHLISEDELFNSLNPKNLINEEIMLSKAKELVELNKSRKETDNITTIIIKTY